jgi:nitrate/nitrite transport system permease protein
MASTSLRRPSGRHASDRNVVTLNTQAAEPTEKRDETARRMETTSRAPAVRFHLLATARRQLVDLLPPLCALGFIVGLWELLCAAPDASLPPPSRVVADTWELIVDPFFDRGGIDKGLFWHIYASVKRVALGYTLASLVGIAIGVLIGSSKLATRALDPIFQVLRTIPPLAWLPLSLAAFRDAQPSAIFVIFITAIWPIIINTAVGIRNIPQDYQNVARVLRLNRGEYFIHIMLPAAAPFIFTGLRIGVGLSWLAIVAGEMLIGGVGIGFFIWDAWNSSRISDIILALIYVGLIGLLLDRTIAVLGRVVTRGTAST